MDESAYRQEQVNPYGQKTVDESISRNTEPPKLSADFFSKLVNQPKCQITGECNNCGRCEH